MSLAFKQAKKRVTSLYKAIIAFLLNCDQNEQKSHPSKRNAFFHKIIKHFQLFLNTELYKKLPRFLFELQSLKARI